MERHIYVTESDLLRMLGECDMTCDDLRLHMVRRAVLSAMPDDDEAYGDEARAVITALDAYTADDDEPVDGVPSW